MDNNCCTHTYRFSAIPEHVKEDLKRNLDLVGSVLALDSDLEGPSIDGYLEYEYENPISWNLGTDVIAELERFSRAAIPETKERTHWQERFLKNDATLVRLMEARQILCEQLSYIEFGCDCESWLVTAEIGGRLYGGIFVFYNRDRPGSVFIQAICKYFAPSMIGLLDAETASTFPNLNSLLQPAVIKLARSIGAHKIYVAPVGKQEKILERHYGFVIEECEAQDVYPSQDIIGYDNIPMFGRAWKIYSKSLE